MKVFISSDMEGTAGVVDWDMAGPGVALVPAPAQPPAPAPGPPVPLSCSAPTSTSPVNVCPLTLSRPRRSLGKAWGTRGNSPTTLRSNRLGQRGAPVATTIVIRPLDKKETTGDSNSNGT